MHKVTITIKDGLKLDVVAYIDKDSDNAIESLHKAEKLCKRRKYKDYSIDVRDDNSIKRLYEK